MKLLRNKKAQNVAEYAILIALVIGAIIAIQTFVKRALQARVRDASQYMVAGTNFGNGSVNYDTAQYVPYYEQSETNTTKYEQQTLTGNASAQGLTLDSSTNAEGTQNATYNEAADIGNGMIFD